MQPVFRTSQGDTQLVYMYDIIIQYILWWYVLYDKTIIYPNIQKVDPSTASIYSPLAIGQAIPAFTAVGCGNLLQQNLADSRLLPNGIKQRK